MTIPSHIVARFDAIENEVLNNPVYSQAFQIGAGRFMSYFDTDDPDALRDLAERLEDAAELDRRGMPTEFDDPGQRPHLCIVRGGADR